MNSSKVRMTETVLSGIKEQLYQIAHVKERLNFADTLLHF